MADAAPTSPSLENRDTEYKPLSILAVAAIAVSGFYILILLALVLVGFISKRAIDDRWHLLIALAGFVLTILARVQIRRSEGTRSGIALTNIAWWMCILGGGGYFAYLQANEATVRGRSGEFTERWFTMLREGKRDAAFLLCLPPEVRSDPTLNPDDPGFADRLEADFAHLYPGYRQNAVTQMFDRNLADGKFEQQSLRSWEYKGKDIHADWTYRVTSPEGAALVSFRTIGTRPKGEKGLAWHIDLNSGFAIRQENMTTFGRVLNNELPREAEKQLYHWLGLLRAGVKTQPEVHEFLAIAAAYPPEKRQTMIDQLNQSLIASMYTGAPVIADTANLVKQLPQGFFRKDDGQPATGIELENFQRIWKIGSFKPIVSRGPTPPTPPVIKIENDTVTASMVIEFTLPDTGALSRGRLIAKIANPSLATQLINLRKDGLNDPRRRDDSKVNLIGTLTDADWQIVGIESNLVPAPVQAEGPRD